MKNVVVLGASDNTERYSYKAVKQLQAAGHNVYPVHPQLKEVLGIKVFADLKNIQAPVDTLTLYLSEKNATPLIASILALKPRRLIFNPGAENEKLKQAAEKVGIQTLEACTLVLLSTHQF